MQTIHSAGTGAMEKTFHIAQRLLSTYDEMPRGERRLADLLLEDVGVLGYLTASDLADQAGVSKATAARLFRRLGYHGYRDAQREVRENKSTKAAAPEVPALSGGFLSPGEYLDAEVKHLVRTFARLHPKSADLSPSSMPSASRARRVADHSARSSTPSMASRPDCER